MLRSLLARYPLILLSCSFIGLVHASGSTKDTLQDEIKQSEANASQAVLDILQTNTKPDPAQNQTSTSASVATQGPPSNTSNIDKAFTPTDNTSNTPASLSHPSNKNPWLQPNPWAKQPPNIWEKNAKVNPYANAAIPGPTPPNLSTSTAIPSPPNIFAPSRSTHSNCP